MNVQVYLLKPDDFNPKAYVTAVYVKSQEKYLFLQTAESKKEANKWGVPAGKLEKDELPEEGMRRELFEETGIQAPVIESLGLLYIRKPEIDYIFHIFGLALEEEPHVRISQEHMGYVWVDSEELKKLDLMGGAKEAFENYITISSRIRAHAHKAIKRHDMPLPMPEK